LKLPLVSSLPSALDARDRIFARLAGRQPTLFLDYDGTLTPIVQRPEDAALSDAMRARVRRVAALCPVTIVSGRDREDVQALVGIEGLGYAGSHGFDIRGPTGSSIGREVGVEHLADLDGAESALRTRLAGVSGAQVERKRYTLATHFRRVAAAQWARVEATVDAVRREYPSLRKERGKAVFELRPDVAWDKGAAVLWLLQALGVPDALPMYLGDDLTDESVFEAIADRGIGIIVSETDRTTYAQFALRGPDEVGAFLDMFAEMLARRGGAR